MMASRFREWRFEWVVWVCIIAYVAFFGTLTVRQHNAFQTTAFDLGNVDQAVWNTRHGRPLAMTNIEGLTNRLGTHVEPILLPISLLYFIWSNPRALLLLQTVIIALGAWPVFLIAQRATQIPDHEPPITKHVARFTSHALPLVFALVYLLFPALQSANAFDFHALALAPSLFLFAFYCLETEQWGFYALFAVLTMSCKEDMPLLVAMLGLYALVVRRKHLVGLATIAVGLTWFLVAVGWIMPHFDTQGVSPLANRYAYLGDSPSEMVVTLITRPGIWLDHLLTADNLAYVRDLLTPVAFLSLLAPLVLVLTAPPLAVNLLSTDGFMHQLEGFHYSAPLVPVVVVSAVYGAAWLIRRFPRLRYLPLLLAAVMLTVTLLYHCDRGYTPLAADFSGSWPNVTGHHRLGEDIAGDIPTEASLAALPFPNPHASQRQLLYMIDRVENGLPAPLHDAEYVWLDVTDGWPLHPNDLKTGVEKLLAGDYGLAWAVDGWLLLQRNAPNRTLPDSFYDFARAAEPHPQYTMHLQFLLDGEPALECLGFDLHYHAQSTAHSLTFYWRALQPLPPGLRLYPFYLDDATGRVLEDTTLRPMIATIWYPPERWQPGEVVVTSTLPWDVGSSFSVGLGVVRGNDWGDVGQRLPIHVISSEMVVRLFEDDTWARLLHVLDGQPIEEYRAFDAPSPKQPVVVDFGPIRLLGYNLECDSRLARCDLVLFWQAQARPTSSYTVFAQILGPNGNVQSQVDSTPQGGGYPTVWWLPGEVVIDPITIELPPDAPRDMSYRLIVGLYDSTTGARLPASGTGTNFAELTVIEP